jgi:hypothetical protein
MRRVGLSAAGLGLVQVSEEVVKQHGIDPIAAQPAARGKCGSRPRRGDRTHCIGRPTILHGATAPCNGVKAIVSPGVPIPADLGKPSVANAIVRR